MVNLAPFNRALKLTWMRRLLESDSKWQDIDFFQTWQISRVQCRIHQE